MTAGYILLHRKLVDSPLWTQLPLAWLKAWIAILLRANFQGSSWWDGSKQIELPAGSFVASLETLAKFASVSVRQIRGTLKYLETTGAVTRVATSQYSIITITNWDAYQFPEPPEGKRKGKKQGKATASDTANGRQTDGERTTTEEQEQQEQTLFDTTTVSKSPSLRDLISVWFESEFWPIYPNQMNKTPALKAALKCAKTARTREEIMAGLRAQLPELLHSPEFIPHPTTWLNQERWKNPVRQSHRQQERVHPKSTPVFDPGAVNMNLPDHEFSKCH